ncbi:MAG UNVERIFIED_CONTAM: hypothetical protein LVT10_20010 [Anaerolineae bacterium]
MVPLRLASLLGLVFMGLGFVLIVYVVGVFLFVGRVVPGVLFLSVTVSLFSGYNYSSWASLENIWRGCSCAQ